MTPVGLFALSTLEQTKEGPRARLLFRGELLELVVAGAVLEAQFATGEEFLLLTTDDCPYEEVLHLYLLDSAAGVVDRVDLGGAYAPGILRDLQPAGPNCLEFSFNGPERWRVTVRAKPRGRLFGKHRLELCRCPTSPLL